MACADPRRTEGSTRCTTLCKGSGSCMETDRAIRERDLPLRPSHAPFPASRDGPGAAGDLMSW
eukprot:6897587-Ditylum_brightwellii.AAC.1